MLAFYHDQKSVDKNKLSIISHQGYFTTINSCVQIPVIRKTVESLHLTNCCQDCIRNANFYFKQLTFQSG